MIICAGAKNAAAISINTKPSRRRQYQSSLSIAAP